MKSLRDHRQFARRPALLHTHGALADRYRSAPTNMSPALRSALGVMSAGTKFSRITPLASAKLWISAITAGCLSLACANNAWANHGCIGRLARTFQRSPDLHTSATLGDSWTLRARNVFQNRRYTPHPSFST